MPTLYNTVTINRKTGEAIYSDPVELTDEEFERAARPLFNQIINKIIQGKRSEIDERTYNY